MSRARLASAYFRNFTGLVQYIGTVNPWIGELTLSMVRTYSLLYLKQLGKSSVEINNFHHFFCFFDKR